MAKAPLKLRIGPLKDRAKDLYFINHPDEWPAWPFLPIKRYTPDFESAVLHTSNPTRAVKANLFALPKTKAEFDALPFTDYESVEALLADGWKVD